MTTTIQATGKRHKLHMLLAMLLICVGVVFVVISVDSRDSYGTLWGSIVALAGLAWYLAARVRAWWHHG